MSKLKSWFAVVATLLTMLALGHRWLTGNERAALKVAKEQRDDAINKGDKLAHARAEGGVARIRLIASQRSRRPMSERVSDAVAAARAARAKHDQG